MTPPTLRIKGIKGDDGKTPSSEEIVELIKPLIPEPIKGEDGKDGETPTEEKIVELIKPLIPKPIKGEKGEDGIDGISPVLDYDKIAKKLPKEDITPKIISEIKKLNKDEKSKVKLDIKDLKGGKEIIREVQNFYGTSGQEYRIDGVKKAGNASVLNLKAGTNITLSGSPTSDGADITINATSSGSVTDVTATSPITSSGGTAPVISSSMATNKLIGRGTAGTGVMEEITLGTGLSLTGTTLNGSTGASIGGAVTGGTAGSVLFVNPDSVLAQNNQSYFWDNTLKSLLVSSTLGSELLTNGTFSGNATGWTLPSGWAYSANTVVHSSNGAGAMQPSTALTTVIVGFEYQYSIEISALTVGTATLGCGGLTLGVFSANGTYTGKFVATSNANLTITPTSTSRFTVDNVSLKRLSGGSVYAGSHVGDTHTAVKSALGATTSAGFIAENTTPATSGVQQASPSILRKGQGYLSNTGASFPFEVQDYVIGKVNITPYGQWINQWRGNSGSWAEFFSFDADPVGAGFSFTPPSALSNTNPGTTRNATFNNAGNNSYLDFKFSGTLKAVIGATSSGAVRFYQTGGSGVEFYSGTTSPTLYSYNYGTAFVHVGYGEFGLGVIAGSQSQPTSTLQSWGGTALKVTRKIADTDLDNSATHWLLDATNAQSCTGTASTACASHGDQSACEANDSHGGCTWNAGSACSAFDNEYGMGTCAGTSGCSVSTSACTGGDETSCLANDDSYGGSCSWDGSDCSAFSGDEGTCSGTSGCTPNYSGCSWDGMTCSGNIVCDAIFDEGTCISTMYFSSCTGTYYTCNGTYNTGSCTGTYGAGCVGTPTCAGIDDSTSCGAETGCTWSSVLNAQLPDGETCQDRTYWLYNDSSGGADVVVKPYSGQTVNETTSYTLGAYRDWVHFAYYKKTANCSAYDADESTCNSTSGCSANYSGCTWNGSSCEGGGLCTSQGDEAACTSYTYFSSCSGTYAVSKNWYKFGS